jgi:hypothetical protein
LEGNVIAVTRKDTSLTLLLPIRTQVQVITLFIDSTLGNRRGISIMQQLTRNVCQPLMKTALSAEVIYLLITVPS